MAAEAEELGPREGAGDGVAPALAFDATDRD